MSMDMSEYVVSRRPAHAIVWHKDNPRARIAVNYVNPSRCFTTLYYTQSNGDTFEMQTLAYSGEPEGVEDILELAAVYIQLGGAFVFGPEKAEDDE